MPSRIISTLSDVRQLNSNDMYWGLMSKMVMQRSLRSLRRPLDQERLT